MPDENKLRDAADAVRGIVEAVPVYQDLAQPAAKELGRSLETLAKSIQVALAPVSALVWGYERVCDFLQAALERRLKGIPPEALRAPDLSIVVPAVVALSYTYQHSELRSMFADLIASSMKPDPTAFVHPAYVEIIKQLMPDEAKILRLFGGADEFPVLSLSVTETWSCSDQSPAGRVLDHYILTDFTLVAEKAGCARADLLNHYLDNLARLKLLEVPKGGVYRDRKAYEELENHPTVSSVKAKSLSQGKHAMSHYGVLAITDFGRGFCGACIGPANDSAAL